MPLTAEQGIAAEAARRLSSDPYLAGLLNRMIKDATEQAILIDDPAQREAARQLVLAIVRLRAELGAAASLPEAMSRIDAFSLEME